MSPPNGHTRPDGYPLYKFDVTDVSNTAENSYLTAASVIENFFLPKWWPYLNMDGKHFVQTFKFPKGYI